MVSMLSDLQAKLADDSVLVLQSERHAPLEALPIFLDWEKRTYGRNVLFLWQKGQESAANSARRRGARRIFSLTMHFQFATKS